MTENADLKNVPLDELLADLTGPEPKPSSPVVKWLEARQIYPGTTKTQCRDLYADFCAWCRSDVGITGKIPPISQFGAELNRRFKRSKDHNRAYYYISRQVMPAIPKNLNKIKPQE